MRSQRTIILISKSCSLAENNSTIANEELAKQLIAANADEALNSLEEIAAWIQSHPDDAAAMNKAIGDLEALVGTLPAGITATTVVGYIQEVSAAVAAEKSRAEGIEGGLASRLDTIEGKAADTAFGRPLAFNRRPSNT